MFPSPSEPEFTVSYLPPPRWPATNPTVLATPMKSTTTPVTKAVDQEESAFQHDEVMFSSLPQQVQARLVSDYLTRSFSPRRTNLRVWMVFLMILCLLCYIGLIVWGLIVTNRQTDELQGVPTISDMLAENAGITVFYIIVVSIFGEVRILWGILYMLDPMIPSAIRAQARLDLVCGRPVVSWLYGLTLSNIILGISQIVLLLVIGVVPVQGPRSDPVAHSIIAGVIAIVSIVLSFVLIIRREMLHSLYRRAKVKNLAFGHGKYWPLFRFLNYFNTFMMLASGVIFVVLASMFSIDNAAIAEYVIFLAIILDTWFKVLDTGTP